MAIRILPSDIGLFLSGSEGRSNFTKYRYLSVLNTVKLERIIQYTAGVIKPCQYALSSLSKLIKIRSHQYLIMDSIILPPDLTIHILIVACI